MRRTTLGWTTLAALIAAIFAVQASAQSAVENPKYPAPAHEKQAPKVEKNLKVFDTLDFDVFSNQKWDRLGESHAKDIIVTWPDGHETKGIEKHIEDLKAMFVYAPDITIKVHPIRFGSGSWTTATGVMTGTFSKPMPIGDGKSLGGDGEMVRVVVTFDTDKPGFPVSMTKYLELTSGSIEVIAKYSEFVDVGGKLLPTKFENGQITNGKQSSSLSELQYFPEETLDTSRCYLEYYGIARPGLLAEADFGRKTLFGFWLTLTLSIVGGLGVLYFFYQRSRQNYV